MDNPFLDLAIPAVGGLGFSSFGQRRKLTKAYSFAIPDEDAIKKLVDLSPIVELGAGTGYWASLIEQMGGEIEAFERYPMGTAVPKHDGMGYGWTGEHFKDLQIGGVEQLMLRHDATLFLCWPCYDTPFAYDALMAFEGTTFAYVGEGYMGCTGDEKFHDLLEADWERVDYHYIPTWEGIHDYLSIWRRK